MKVLFTWHASVERSYRRLFEELVSLGADIRLIAPSRWTEAGRMQYFQRKGTENYGTAALSTAFTDHIRAFFYPNVYRIVKEMRGFRPDIIHIMEEPFSLAAYEMMRLQTLFAPRAKTVLFSFENIDVVQKPPYSFFQSFNIRHSGSMIVVPAESAALWRGRGFTGNIAKIPLGIDTELYKKMPARPYASRRASGEFKAGYAGRVVKEKGIETVIEALGILMGGKKNCSLHIAGDGDNKEAVLRKARAIGVESRVHFLGALTQEGLPVFYNSIDALILPSLTTATWKEQFGRVLAEAMACGTPVIGSSSGEIPGVIGDAGLVFNEGAPEGLAHCIVKLMDDKGLASRLSEAGMRRARSEYSWRAVAEKYMSFYGELCG